MSPRILSEKDLIFWFHSHDFRNENRASVHVGKGSQNDFADAKVWIEPQIEVARQGSTLRPHELTRAIAIIKAKRVFMLEEWYDRKRRA